MLVRNGVRFGVMVVVLFLGMANFCFGQEFAYKQLDENKIEFKAGGETFLFDGSNIYGGLKLLTGMKKISHHWFAFSRYLPDKKRHCNVYIEKVKDVKLLFDREDTKAVQIICSAKSVEGKKSIPDPMR